MNAMNRNPFPLPLVVVSLLVGILLAASPAPGEAQIGFCKKCVPSDELYPEDNDDGKVCSGAYEGKSNCAQIGGGTARICITYGESCDIPLDAANDQLAISMVTTGRMLPANGNYFFVMDGDDSVIMRKCDRSLVARIAGNAYALAGRRPDRVAPSHPRSTTADEPGRDPRDRHSVYGTVMPPRAS